MNKEKISLIIDGAIVIIIATALIFLILLNG